MGLEESAGEQAAGECGAIVFKRGERCGKEKKKERGVLAFDEGVGDGEESGGEDGGVQRVEAVNACEKAAGEEKEADGEDAPEPDGRREGKKRERNGEQSLIGEVVEGQHAMKAEGAELEGGLRGGVEELMALAVEDEMACGVKAGEVKKPALAEEEEQDAIEDGEDEQELDCVRRERPAKFCVGRRHWKHGGCRFGSLSHSENRCLRMIAADGQQASNQ